MFEALAIVLQLLFFNVAVPEIRQALPPLVSVESGPALNCPQATEALDSIYCAIGAESTS
jgi:hypothetical protein